MITSSLFDTLADGTPVTAYTMQNSAGASVTVLNLGGILQSLCIPDRDGVCDDIVMGFDRAADYLASTTYAGALIGRYANRIRFGRFTLNGKTYQLACNDGDAAHLHGGNIGYNARLWNVAAESGETEDRLILTLHSPDMEEGYPGALSVQVTYTFTASCVLSVDYTAVSDADTIVNLTNHAYFNLRGRCGGDVSALTLCVHADRYTESDALLLPTGRELPVEGTPFDLRTARPLTEAYDHNFVLRSAGAFACAAELCDPASGRTMQVFTDMPGIQIYTANFLCEPIALKGGMPQKKHTAVCLETQFAPDSPNHPQWPSCILRAGETYRHRTEFRFGCQ